MDIERLGSIEIETPKPSELQRSRTAVVGIGEEDRNATYDFLRGIAILAVIQIHVIDAFPSLQQWVRPIACYGRFGVQLFFYVSALSLCHVWEKRRFEKNLVKNFLIRRFFRIAPLFYLSLPILPLYFYFSGQSTYHWAPHGIHLRHILTTAFFVNGFWPDSINTVVPGGWSIAVEMTFYLIFPFLMLRLKNPRSLLPIALASWVLYVFVGCPILRNYFAMHTDFGRDLVEDFINLNFFNNIPVFALGIFLYYQVRRKLVSDAFLIVLLGGWLLAGWALYAGHLMEWNQLEFLFVALSLFTLVWGALRFRVHNNLTSAIGRHSYALYLMHFFLLQGLTIFIPHKPMSVTVDLVIFVLATVVAFAMAMVVDRWFERPIKKLTRSLEYQSIPS